SGGTNCWRAAGGILPNVAGVLERCPPPPPPLSLRGESASARMSRGRIKVSWSRTGRSGLFLLGKDSTSASAPPCSAIETSPERLGELVMCGPPSVGECRLLANPQAAVIPNCADPAHVK